MTQVLEDACTNEFICVWRVGKKCYTCEFPLAASKLDKLNGVIKNILIKSGTQIFILW